MQFIAIVLLSVAAAVSYGIVLDQITARVCVEYFTVGHRPVVPTTDPTTLAFIWGVLATWWVGVLLGVPLAIAARYGGRPKCAAASLVRPLAFLVIVSGGCALAAGAIGWLAASRGWIFLVEPLASRVPAERHVPFLADLWAHVASYSVGFVGGIAVIVSVWRSRGRSAATVACRVR